MYQLLEQAFTLILTLYRVRLDLAFEQGQQELDFPIR